VWLGVYRNREKDINIGLRRSELLFNVAWNIWREIAEIGAFLIPFFLGEASIEAIPLSGAMGVVIGLIFGAAIYAATLLMEDRRYLAFLVAFLTGWLSTGLFTCGCHEIEEVAGETAYAWKISAEGLSKDKFPMVLLKRFGWTHHPTVLWIAAFAIWGLLLVAVHVARYTWLKRKAAEEAGPGKV